MRQDGCSLRKIRLERKTRYQFRCEWCNGKVMVSRRVWAELMKDRTGHWLEPDRVLELKQSLIVCCSRERCLRSRPENWSGLTLEEA